MKNSTNLLLFLLLCSCFTTWCPAPKEPPPCDQTSGALTIFTNESENSSGKLGPVGTTLYDMLEEKEPVSMIVASNHLLNDIKYFKRGYPKWWSAHTLTENISVLVPNNLAAKYRARGGIPNDVDDNHVLGIYFSDKPVLREQDLSVRTIGYKKLSAETKNALLQLFIPRTDYWQRWHGERAPKTWTFLFIGHGTAPYQREGTLHGNLIEYEGRIAGLVTSDVQDLLSHLSGKIEGGSGAESTDIQGIINIASSTFISCFLDLNMLIAFNKNPNQQLANFYDFPYPIILLTPLAAEVPSRHENYEFKRFFTMLHEGCAYPDFLTAVEHIAPQSLDNIPVIKKPGIPFFFPIDPNKSVAIGKTMGIARTDPLVIPDYFKREDIRAILIGAEKIPFTVILKPMKQLPPFFSSVVGPSTHEFTKLDARDYLFSDIISAFTTTRQLTWKAFKFNTLIAQDKNKKVQTYTNVSIINSLEHYEIADKPQQQVRTMVKYSVVDADGNVGRTNFFEKIIAENIDTQAFGEKASTNPRPLGTGAEQNLEKLFGAISDMALHPNTEPPDIHKISEFFERHVEKATPEWQAATVLEKLTRALKKLIEPQIGA